MQRSAISSGWTTMLVSKLNHAWDLHNGEADYDDDVGSSGGSGGCLGLYECFQIHNQVHRPSSLLRCSNKMAKVYIMLLLVAFAISHVIGFFDGQVKCLLVGLIKGVCVYADFTLLISSIFTELLYAKKITLTKTASYYNFMPPPALLLINKFIIHYCTYTWLT